MRGIRRTRGKFSNTRTDRWATAPLRSRLRRSSSEFFMMVSLGMSPLDALKAGTSVDAELLGLQNRVGTLEAGKLADIVVMPGDPLQNIRQTEKVFFVMKEGVIYRNDTNR